MPETEQTQAEATTPAPAPRRTGALSSLDPVAAYERRTARIREEIARNRRGEYSVPTWVLALALAGVVALWILVLFVF
ncbi:hypothetical protein AB0B28_22305 [Glycomyces sp. NPDC046736]|uniref:hypothetical protein n=1 Tax=Glycomyces sp. NPDC046736 TaxID=3155615 RepID=UPI0033E41850